MVAKLYAADVLESAKPVETTTPAVKKEKKPATEKQLAALKKAQETRKRKREEAEKAKILEGEQAAKKVEADLKRLEEEEEKKQARREKAKERRRLKKEQAAQKEVAGDKPQLPVAGTSVAAPITPEPSVGEEPKKKKPRVKKDPAEPPVWFTKFVESGKQEQNLHAAEKKPKKVVKEEAQQVAKEQWKDDHTRDRVNTELQNHAQRMFGMIFANRKL